MTRKCETMLKESKQRVKNFIKSVYENVYIVNFERCSFVPKIEKSVLSGLGKWHIATGKEWIYHSKLEIKDFETLFLNLLDDELKEIVQFEVDYMPFQKV